MRGEQPRGGSSLQELSHVIIGQEAPVGQGGGFQDLIPIVLMFVAVFFLLIWPTWRQNKKHRELIGNLQKGDEVATTSGVWGRIYSLDEHVVQLDIADKCRIKILRSQIAGQWASKQKEEETGKRK